MRTVAFAEGDNYLFEVVDGRAHCRVWRRRDLDSSAGASSAEEISQLLQALAQEPEVLSMEFDVRQAPAFIGPRTQLALGEGFAAFETRRKPLAIVASAAVQGLQFQRVLAVHAPLYGRDFHTREDAAAWLKSFRDS